MIKIKINQIGYGDDIYLLYIFMGSIFCLNYSKTNIETTINYFYFCIIRLEVKTNTYFCDQYKQIKIM